MDIALEIHICDQRRSYTARFATEAQALEFIQRKSSTHAFHPIESEPIDWDANAALFEELYPTCEHGLSLSNCNGPQHYWFDDEEQARGLLNS